MHHQQPDVPDGFASWTDFWRSFFQPVPEAKTQNRVHLDLAVSGRPETSMEERRRRVDAETERLQAAGARLLRNSDTPQHYGATLADLEGNEFGLHRVVVRPAPDTSGRLTP